MGSHSGRSFLNSCLKVPIDPCNNCPAPIYNRPKLYLGRLSMTPTTALATTTVMTTKTCDTETDTKWNCSGIRSLAKLYDSIPDYRELTHLSEEDFYSTLDTLRSTCRDIKIKTATSCVITEDLCSTTSSSLSSANCPSVSTGKQFKKSKKKKKSIGKQSGQSKHMDSQDTESILDFKTINLQKVQEATKSFENFTAATSSKHDWQHFKKSLQDFEAELTRPTTSTSQNRCELTRPTNVENNKLEIKKVPVRPTYTSVLRERLRKSLSFNDLNTIPEPKELIDHRKKTNTLEKLAFKGWNNSDQDPNKLSNYFEENTKIRKITVEPPSSDSPETTITDSGYKQSKCKSKSNDEFKIPFKVFDLGSPKRDSSIKQSTPSPAHPVARPNLAATLRVECSRKKVEELRNNCTYNDTTPQVDWEVRKTPAWKTLSLNESHKEILKIRLATRKAEQALQKREYELNMELMRQRVKTAPLLLEGPTYWGPHVGKLTHDCQREGRLHMCQSNKQRVKRKKNSSRTYSCRRDLFQLSNPELLLAQHEHHQNEDKQDARHYSRQQLSEMSQKMNELHKIYGGSANSKTQSRCSNRSAITQRFLSKSFAVKNTHEKKESKVNENLHEYNESGDDLSSLDRAFL